MCNVYGVRVLKKSVTFTLLIINGCDKLIVLNSVAYSYNYCVKIRVKYKMYFDFNSLDFSTKTTR